MSNTMPKINEFIRVVPVKENPSADKMVFGELYDGTSPESCGGPWVSFLCPCGCGNDIFLPVVGDTRMKVRSHPSWVYGIENGKITLAPSILMTGGCKSHYFIRGNRVDWC